MCGLTLKQLGFIKTVSLVVAWGLGQTLPAQFVAFNEHQGGATTHPNTTLYSVRPPSATNAGFLKNITNGLATGVYLTVTNSPSVAYGGVSGVPNAGSPAAAVFGGFVTLSNGYLQLGASQVVAHVLTGLDPLSLYSLAGTTIKGAATAYSDRWTLFELAGAVSFLPACSPGCLTPGHPGLFLASNQVVLCTGDNRAGDLFGWDDVRPGPSGTVIIYSRRFLGATVSGVFTNNLTTPSYALDALRVEEFGPSDCASPRLLAQPQSLALWPGEPVSFHVTGGGSLPLFYQWFHGLGPSNPIPNATNPVYSIASAAVADAGPYLVQVSNRCGLANSAIATLTLFTDPPVITQSPTNLSALLGSVASFSVVATSPPPLFYQWFKQEVGLSGATNSTYSIPVVEVADAGLYRVRVSNPAGSVTSAVAVLTPRHPLWPDSFSPAPDGNVNAIVIQSDGKIVVGGDFTSLGGGARKYLGRLNGDGSLDTHFDAAVGQASVTCLALQTDGRILVGGTFTTLGGQPRARLSRLNADGTLDPGFTAETDGTVQTLAVQADGKILVGGSFTVLGGQTCRNLGRLSPDGTRDETFNPAPNNPVYCLAPQPDGSTLIGGSFTTVRGQPCSRIVRLTRAGELDGTFTGTANGTVRCLAVQPDGRILLGGDFTFLDDVVRYCLGRFHPDGSLDSPFYPAANVPSVTSLALQADGKILVGGTFTTLNGQPHLRLGRLLPDGSEDRSLALGAEGDASSFVRSVAVQPDGKILVGGSFARLGGQPRSMLGRLSEEVLPAESLVLTNSTLTWRRGGSGPEFWRTTFEVSTDGGAAWEPLGPGLRVAGGWQISPVNLLPETRLRARGFVAGGYGSASSWYVERILGPPVLLSEPQTVLANGGAPLALSIAWLGLEPVTCRWQHDGVDLADGARLLGTRSNVLTITAAQLADSGTYSVVLSNVCGVVVLTAVNLTVLDPRITAQPASQTVRPGTNLLLQVSAAGTDPLAYQWYNGDSPIPGATAASLTVSNVGWPDEGNQFQFSVVVCNSAGCVTSATAVVTLSAPATPDSFDARANGTVWSLAVQADGKVLLGGDFTSLGVVSRGYLGRLEPDGSVDTAFNPGANSASVLALTVQPDGKILVGGSFTSLGGQPRSRLGRLLPDGTPEVGFNPGADGAIQAMALQADGKILLAGAFTTLAGQARLRIGRLLADGTVDSAFNPAANGMIYAVATQPDGKIVVGGAFTTLAGQPRGYLGRIHPDGSLDDSFQPGANGVVYCLLVQPDGKILIGGAFTTLGGQGRSRLARLHPDGTLEGSFNPGPDNAVYSLALQTDGQMLVGGEFTMLGGMGRSRLGRLNPDGSLDGTFAPDATGTVCALGLQADGKTLVGGSLTALGGQTRGRLARLESTSPVQSSLALNGSSATWLRQGSSPEVCQVRFEVTTNGGAAWVRRDDGLRIPNGWLLEGVPPLASVRAQGFVTGGYGNGSGWFVEALAGLPYATNSWQNIVTNPGASLVLAITATSASPVTYQWQKDGVDLVEGPRFLGTRSNVLVISNAQPADSGTYSLVLINAAGSLRRPIAGLTVPDPTIISQPADQSAFVGASATFTVGAAGTAPLSYQWWRDGLPVAGATAPSLTIPSVQEADDGATFVAWVGNSSGSVTSTLARLRVLHPVTVDSFGTGADGNVYALAVQPDGRVLVGGSFMTLGGQPRNRLGRLNADGSVQTSFDPIADGTVYALAVQPDGEVLVGGQFAALGGKSYGAIGRLHPGGALDATFAPTADGPIQCLVLQSDGKILVGGSFTTLNGQNRNRLGRLNPDGSLDAVFNPGADGPVHCLALQPDARILVGGSFTALGGVGRSRLARLNPNGTLDTTLATDANGTVLSLAVQADGAILVGGDFSTLAGQARRFLGRLQANGTLDTGFNPGANTASVTCFALQADGKILVGGSFTTLGGLACNRIGRLNPDGSPDSTFNPGSDSTVYSLALQPDGKVLVGGSFSTLSGQPRSRLARLNNTVPASQTVTWDSSNLVWLRGGTSPEVWQTTLEASTNAGSSWLNLGAGARVAGGWSFTGLEVGAGTSLRVRGTVASGCQNASGWFTESYLGAPALLTAPQNLLTNVGATMVLTVEAQGSPPLTYQWRRNGVDLAEGGHFVGTASNVLVVANLLGADAGAYSVAVSNAFGLAAGLIANVSVADPLLTSQPLSQVVWVGTNVTFRATAAGTTPLQYTWYKNGSPVSNATGATLTFANASLSDDASQYRLVVSNAFGSVTSAVALLSVVVPSVLDTLDAAVGGTVWCLALQNDGKILLAGDFPTLGGQTRNCLGRLNADGTLDPTFNPGASPASLVSLTVQADGKILVGGAFTTLAGRSCSRLGRLNPDGTLDASFSPGANDRVWSVLVLPDGAVLVGGDFTSLGGLPRNHLGRLKADGSVDPDFNPGPDGSVYALAAQSDGKVLVGGTFGVLGGQSRSRLGRLNPDGSVDTSFNPGANGTVRCLLVQADGNILLAGDFTGLGGRLRSRLGRLLPTGSVDLALTTSADDTIYSLLQQADGKVLVGGAFTSLGGQPRNRLGRLNLDGTLDPAFTPTPNNLVCALAMQDDGSILVGGNFTTLAGQARGYLGRLGNTTPARQSLVWTETDLSWFRSAASPEVWRTTLELSSAGGSSWSNLASGTRQPGGWGWSGLAVPAGATLRARGFVTGGTANASGWFVESFTGLPYFTNQVLNILTNASAQVVLSVWPVSGSPLTYRWQKDGLDLPANNRLVGLLSNVLTVTSMLAADAGTYSVVVSNRFGLVTRLVATLIVVDPLINTQPADQEVFAGQNAVFTIAAAGTSPLSYQWFRAGIALPGSTAPSLTLTNVSLSDHGSQFRVLVSNSFGCLTSSVASLTILSPAIPDSFSPAADATVYALALQPDGKLIVGGDFQTLAGQPRSRLGRLYADGTLDTAFLSDADSSVAAVALQTDGKILVAGQFTHLAGQARPHLARLNADGTLDASFNPGTDGAVQALLVQADGRILVAGAFGTLAGQSRNQLGRLNSDGTLDPLFNPGANGAVYTLALQPDGKILVGGGFTSLGGQPRSCLGRLDPAGSLDASFAAEPNGTVWCLAVQADGKILAGGDFTSLGNHPRSFLGRFRPDGTIDPDFNPGANSPSVTTLALQTDGRILVGGGFTFLGGQTRSYLGRLKPDGSLDTTFNPGCNGPVHGLLLQPDARVIAAGAFTTTGGQPRARLARVSNTIAALQDLAWSDTAITWLRSGSSPEVWRTTCEFTTNAGLSWLSLGTGLRIPGGWQFSGPAPVVHASLRARGFVAAGRSDGSGWFVEAGTGLPRITTPPQSLLTNAGAAMVLEVAAEGSAPLTWQWRKDGLVLPEGGRLTGTRTRVLVITNLLAADAGAYSVIVSNLLGQTTGLIATVLVADPFITRQPSSQAVWAGTNVSFSVTAAGTAPLNYQWYAGPIPLPGATVPTLTVSNVQPADEATPYRAVVTNPAGSATSTVALLTILRPAVPDSFAPAADSTIYALAIQADGKMVVGGDFTLLSNQARSRLARLAPDGTVDPSFSLGTDNSVFALALQPDGKLLVAGEFTSVGGQTRNRLARLNADATLEATFNPGANAAVRCVALQPDGKLLVGGAFTTLAGQPRACLARLNPDGSLDSAFNPGADSTIYSLAVQPDGAILVGGSFGTLAGQPRSRLSRLHSDGRLDTAFVSESFGTVWAVAVQADGKILVGGDFTSLNDYPRGYLGRLNPDGSLDAAFNPGANSPAVTCFALQTDGKILVGGQFTVLAGLACNRLGRLNADGTADLTFNPGSDNAVYSLAVQPDGEVLVGGTFHVLGGQPRSRLARLHNTLPARQSLTWSDAGLTWLRGGSSPEVWRTTFEVSTNDGLSWVLCGAGVRGPGGWSFSDVPPPAGARGRARGWVAGGHANASDWFVETRTRPPLLPSQPGSIRTNLGVILVLSAATEGTDPRGFRWQKDGLSLSESSRLVGTASNVLVLVGTEVADSGSYSLVISNSFGWVSGLVATVTVADPCIVRQPASRIAWLGTNLVLDVGALGSAPLTYQWFTGGMPIPNATNPSLSVMGVSWANDSNQYQVVVSNPSGSETSAVAVLTVAALPVPDAFAPYVNGSVWCLAVQPEGQILLGGDFSVVSNSARRYLARLHADGSLDTGFALDANQASVLSLTVQTDGRIVVGGGFTTLAGQPRNRLARIGANGTLDPSFNPGADGLVRTTLELANGTLLVGGDFTTLAGQPRNRLGRLYPDGSLDTSLNPGADGPVYTLALQQDGKILVGGSFTTVSGQARSRLARLHPDGSLDSSFNPGADGLVRCLVVQPDGRILAAGDFTACAGQACSRVARLGSDGSSDALFAPTADDSVHAIALQADGRILLGGSFSLLNGQAHRFLGRLKPDGSLDSLFPPEADATVCALGLQEDGSVLVGGAFSTLAGLSRSRLGRLNNTSPGLQHLALRGSVVTWLWDGPAPELSRTQLEASTDGGSSWSNLGPGLRIAGGWQWPEGVVPPNASLQAHGVVAGGSGSASHWVIEALTGLPYATNPLQHVVTNAQAQVLFSVAASSGPPLSYQWRHNGVDLPANPRFSGLHSNVLLLTGLIATDAGAYSVILSNVYGTVNRPVATLTLVDPLITGQPLSQIAWLGTNLVLNVVAGGTPPLTYQWFRNETLLPGMTASALTLTNVQWTDEASSFRAVVSNSSGSVTSQTALLRVFSAPVPDSLVADANGTVWCLAVQPDGKILLGGDFTTLGDQTRSYLGRLHPDGRVETGFNPGASPPSVLSLTLQTDGKILVGGAFTTLGGQPCNRFGRLNADGTFDTAFHPNPNEQTRCAAVQADGRILVGGSFTSLDGVLRYRLGRLNGDGSVDTTFDPGANGPVFALTLQPDGKVLVGGTFTSLAGQPRARLGRLNPDGSLDSSFNPGADGAVRCFVAQPDGQILVGGDFTTLGGQTRSGLGRLTPDGLLDSGFASGAAGSSVLSLALQTDGKILVAGVFQALGGQSRAFLGRLQPDGTLDDVFDPVVGSVVFALGMQADGAILAGGIFATVGGQARLRLARLHNTVPASMSLECDGSTLRWFRAGASPEVWRTTFELSSDGGISWTNLGAGARVQGHWELGGLAVPPTGTIRARGFLAGGNHNASGWFVQTIGGAPHLTSPPLRLVTNVAASVVLTAASDSSSRLTYQWQFNGLDLVESADFIGTRSNVLILPSARSHHSGAYSVVLSSFFGVTTGLVANLMVTDPLLTAQPVSQSVWLGSNALFNVTATGTSPLSYQWFATGGLLPGATTPTLLLTNVRLADDGTEFWVLVSNAAGTATSAVARLTVMRPPIPDALAAAANSTVYALARQPDGAILVGGDFTLLSGQSRYRLGRLSAEGVLDLSFNPGADGSVFALALQADRSVLVAGGFTRLAGQPRGRLGRFNPDGTLDLVFNPGADAPIRCLALQPDGKILVAGSFTTLAGQPCLRLGRLNPDGSLDTSFHPSPDDTVYSLALQPDGRILVGGSFTLLGGVPCERIGRLNPDGSIDPAFWADANGTIWCLAVQPDGKVLVGGDFTLLDGQGRSYLGRLNRDGTPDSEFSPALFSPGISCLALQTDGRILLAGSYPLRSGQLDSHLGRLNSDGSLDSTFDPGCDGAVYALTVQPDGKVLVGGAFGTLGGQARSGLGRLDNTTVPWQSLAWSGTNLTWLRAGTSPEVWRASFDLSTNAGRTWLSLGAGGRIEEGWALGGTEPPPNASLRARGFVAGGYQNASGWYVEEVIGAPVIITPFQDLSTNAGASVRFTVAVLGTMPQTFQWQKDGVDLVENATFAGTRSESLLITDLQETETGAYSVMVGNAFGAVTNPCARLTILDPWIVRQPTNQVGVLGATASFFAAGGGTAPLFYQWYQGATPLPGATNPILTLADVQSGQNGAAYHVVVSGPFGCVTSAVAALTVVVSLPTADSFDARANSTIHALAVQPDGKILAGGAFTAVGDRWQSYLGRFDADGHLDLSFQPAVDVPSIRALTVQADGKILAGGEFTALGGQPRSRLGRLNPDGSPDASFAPGANGPVGVLQVQPDGRILVAGNFTTLGGQPRNRIGRLYPDGSVDLSFNPGANGRVYSLALQPDGKILVGGAFVTLAGQARLQLGRLNPDGSLDATFIPSANFTVYVLALQADGRILVGGGFTELGGLTRLYLARLLPDGSLDPTFNPTPDGPIQSIAVQADGRILVGGQFTWLAGHPRRRLGCLYPDGSLDTVFSPETDATVYALALQGDGQLLVGGAFTTLAGQSRGRLGRILSPAQATQSLVRSGSTFTWARGGSCAEVWQTTWQLSTNGGSNWLTAGLGTRVSGGWLWDGAILPPNASVRARGWVAGGDANGCGWPVQTLGGAPVFLSQPPSLRTNVGAYVSFRVRTDGTAPLAWQWRKDGVDLADGPRLSGTRGDVLTLSPALPEDAGDYSVLVSNPDGQNPSQVASLVLEDPFLTVQPTDQTAVQGATAVFQAQAVGTPPLSYQWFKGAILVPGATTPMLTLSNAQGSDDGALFRLVAANARGSVTSVWVALTVVATPVAVDAFHPPLNGTVWALGAQLDGSLVAGGDFTQVGDQPRHYLSRFNPDGSLGPPFLPEAVPLLVSSVVLLPDGRILIGGQLPNVEDGNRNRFVRLNPDGTSDPSFDPDANGPVRSVFAQADGRILVAGEFTFLGGQSRRGLARLNADGTLDPGFNPGADGLVCALLAQPDGSLLVGGSFTNLAGQPCPRLGRLQPDGSLDVSFNPRADGTIWCLAGQADGRILVGGAFATLGGQPRHNLARLLPDGRLDQDFSPDPDGSFVSTLALQADGGILVGGNFSTVGGQPRHRLGRLHPDGTLDLTFTPETDNPVYALGLQDDGHVLVGGYFSLLGWQTRSCLGRVRNTAPASQSLLRGASALTWLRGGTSPEVWRTTFEASADGGATWNFLGAGLRVPGGWQVSAPSMSPSASVRARGFVLGGAYNASGWVVETIFGPVGRPRFATGLDLHLSGGQFHLRLRNLPALPGQVVLEASSDLRIGWTPILTNSTPLDVLDYAEPVALPAAQRFYRALWRQP